MKTRHFHSLRGSMHRIISYLTLFIRLLMASSYDASTVSLHRMEASVNVFSSAKWTKLEPHHLKDDHVVQAIFVLQYDSAEIQALEHKFHDLSDPTSKNYGKWLQPDELFQLVSRKESHAKVVMDYLHDTGVAREHMVFSAVGDKVHVSMPVAVANRALNTEFALFQSTTKSDIVLARIIKPYHLPAHVAAAVSFVDDIMRFPSVDKIRLGRPNHTSSKWSLSAAKSLFNSCGSKCLGYTTPSVLSQRYGFTSMPSSATNNSMAVAEFSYEYYTATDLNTFSLKCGIQLFSVQTTIGGNVESVCDEFRGTCAESLLDIEYIKAVASAVPLTVIYSSQYSLLGWIDQVLSMKTPPLVHSVSYGNDEVQQQSVQYMYSCNAQFMAAGVRGLSILFASGDQGVWGRTGVSSMFHPDFPSSSPYVTSVGGTEFQTASVVGPETAWNCSGGGFSNTFSQATWQSSAITSFLSTASLPPSSYFNVNGRGYPDVSALGGGMNPYCVSIGSGKLVGIAGTSAATPVVAGIVAQLNDIRLKAGKSSLGFLNPLFYANPKCFYDVDDGSNNACSGIYGFPATIGWDPATGLGTPNFQCLKNMVTAL